MVAAASITRLDEIPHAQPNLDCSCYTFVTIDNPQIDQDNGNIHYISGSLEAMLGYQEGSLSNGNVPLSRIMPSPYAFMHQKFVADVSPS